MNAYLANGGLDVELNATYDDYETGLVYLCEDPPSSIAVETAGSFVAIFCVGVSGNALLLYVLLRYEDLRHVTSLLVLNMAASDLLFAATLPFWSTYHLSHWVFGPALCRVLVGAYLAGLYCGLMFLTALTVDRYVTVVRGRSARRGRRLACARSACAALWLVGVPAASWEMAATGAGPGTVHNGSNSLWKEGVTGGEVSVATPKINPGMELKSLA